MSSYTEIWCCWTLPQATSLRCGTITRLRLRLDGPVQPGLLLSPDQSRLLLIYDGWWHRGKLPRQDRGAGPTGVHPGDSLPLIDFGP